ncbi:MAG: hypothetical protein K6G88_06020 [Lachnospiraceae bacterium]|nr:hypothetical protein [Lachnospiraceae bacterium]
MGFIKNMDYEEKRNFRTAIISIVMMITIFAGEVWAYNEINMLDYTWKMTGKSPWMTFVATVFVAIIGLMIAYIYGCIPSGWRISKDKMPHLDGWILIMPIMHWIILGYFKFVLRVVLSLFWGVLSFPGYLLGSKFPKLKNKKLCGACTIIVFVAFGMFVSAVDKLTENAFVSNEEKMRINYEKQVEIDNYFTK